MGYAPEVLDAAFDRLGRWGFDEPGGYVNHGPMAAEALDALGRWAEVDAWSRLDSGTPPAVPVAPRWTSWVDALGDLSRAGEWIGHFERSIDEDGWPHVLAVWLPRLMPGLGTALFHGTLRTAHATRAIATADTRARRDELARALGYWASFHQTGHAPERAGDGDARLAIVRSASDAARHYLARPNIIQLHGVTAAMAVSILVDHTDDVTATSALAQLDAELAAIHDGVDPVDDVDVHDIDDTTLIDAAVVSGEAHAVKLVDACRRAYAATGDPVFVAASERVVRRGLRTLRAQE